MAEGYAAEPAKVPAPCRASPRPSARSADFVAAAEEIHGQTDFDQTMAMRINPRISGYGLTQLNDCAWEFAAGLLDRWRRPKPSLARVRAANDPLQILLWPGRYAFAREKRPVSGPGWWRRRRRRGSSVWTLDGKVLAKRGRVTGGACSASARRGRAWWKPAGTRPTAVFTTDWRNPHG